jgi:hypothetical protein
MVGDEGRELRVGGLVFRPAGMPEEANETTSREVKSGRVKVSFSKSADHGSSLMNASAWSTSFWNLRLW